MDYEIVVGLEVHAELNTQTKIYCSCKNSFGSEVNSNCCPVCTGMPGSLPVLNEKVVDYAIRMGHALGCKINNVCKQDRKNYFYPDLPKAYQISQYDVPLCEHGHLDIIMDEEGNTKSIGVTRIHIEEDAGKLLHSDRFSGSLVDLNRCGVPLIEIVSMPDIHSAAQARMYCEELHHLMIYAGVSNGDLYQGNMRFDVNISVNKPGEPLGTRTELKNLNSFRAVLHAIRYEANRQIEVLENGGKVIQETRRWDDDKGKTYSMRTKEDSQDYRYFPDPDLIPLNVSDEYIASIRKKLPRLAPERQSEYVAMGLTVQDAQLLTAERKISDFFEAVLAEFNEPKFVCNWILAEVFKKLNSVEDEDKNISIDPTALGKMLRMYKAEEINQAGARKVFEVLWNEGGEPLEIVDRLGIKQKNDSWALRAVIEQILSNNPKALEELKAGNQKTMAFFVGQAMKATQGKANPKMVNEIVNELIK